MSMHRIKRLISILMDSPLYLTLSLKERYSLLARIAESSLFLVEVESEPIEVGYESGWAETFRTS